MMWGVLLILTICGADAVAVMPIVTTGSVNPAYDLSLPWVVGSELIVGYQADGTLTVAYTADVTTTGLVLVGDNNLLYADTSGTLWITGLGTTFSIDPNGESGLFIGPLAEGFMTVADGAVLSTHDAIIGGSPVLNESGEVVDVVDGQGHATVSGGATWDLGSNSLMVGAAGSGELTITGSGSSVTDGISEIGLTPGSIGEVVVEESGSWSLSEDLVVGVWGEGALTISGGGQVQSARSWVGGVDANPMDYNEPVFADFGEPNGTGTVVVAGAGSQWDAGDDLYVGSWGTGTLQIESGGQVLVGELYIGGMPITLGEGEELTEDLVPDGTGSVAVSGAGSLLNVTGDDTLYVGYTADGSLDVNDGGQVTSGTVIVGAAPGSTGVVTVDGTDSQLASDDIMLVGVWGQGEVTVSNGSGIDVENLALGGVDPNDTMLDTAFLEAFGDPNGTGTLLVTGTGSLVAASGVAYVGYSGRGIVDVNDGGAVDTSQTMIGVAPGSYGEITVDGNDSSWLVSSNCDFDAETGMYSGLMSVGGYGEGRLTIRNGGYVEAYDTIFLGGYSPGNFAFDANAIGYDPNGTGVITVTGSGSTLISGNILVGGAGQGTLEVLNGGQAGVSTMVLIGADANGVGDVLVDGDGSLLEAGGFVVTGAYNDGTTTISNGGVIRAGVLFSVGGFDPNSLGLNLSALGNDPNGTGTATVTDANSRVETFAVNVGDGGGNGALNILNGATVASQVGNVGVGEGSVGLVTVDGDGSTWRLSGADAPLFTWELEGEGDLVVSNDGLVEVQDPCAILAVADTITVGSEGEATLTITNGGTVVSGSVILGGTNPEYESLADYLDPNANLGTGTGFATVSGAGSSWTTGTMNVGFSGGGSLTISSDGRVTNESGWIGVMPDSAGIVEVNDANWVNTGNLTVGAWGYGQLDITGGGTVTAGEVFIGGSSFESLEASYEPNLVPNGMGQITVAGSGSELAVTGPNALYVGYSGTGLLDVTDGGSVTAAAVILGASPESEGGLIIDGGTLSASSDMVVGAWGEGALMVSDGHAAMNSLFIGGFDANDAPEGFPEVPGDSNGIGEVTVTGEGSVIEVNAVGALHVGYGGQGELHVLNGGTLTSPDSFIGTTSDGAGWMDVNDGTWVNDGNLTVGGQGHGVLVIENGGGVQTSNSVYLGTGTDGHGIAVVMDEGSLWDIGESVYVGGNDAGSVGQGVLIVGDDAGLVVHDELYVWDTGTLGGGGAITVSSLTTLHNYGTISPAGDNDEIGVLTVHGAVVFHDGSTYAVDINDTGSDKLVVDGDVTIEGGTVQVESEGTIHGEREYEILSADSVVGEFNDLDTALLDFVVSDAGLDYNDTSIWLHVTAANFDDPNLVRTDNQIAVGGALQQISVTGGNSVTDALQDVETAGELRAVYDQLSGQTRTAISSMTLAHSSRFLSTVTNRISTAGSGRLAGAFDFSPLADAGPDQAPGVANHDAGGQAFAVGNGSPVLADKRWGLWGRGYGVFGDRETDGGVPGYAYNVYGGSFGVDYQWTERFLAGLVGGTSQGDADFSGSRDNTDFDATHVGLYGSYLCGPWTIDSVATYADLNYDTERFVDALGERLDGDADGQEYAAYVEGSRSYDLSPRLRLAPLASLQYTYVSVDSYTETGGTGALSFDDETHESVRGSLGARLTRRLIESMGSFQADLQLRGRWVHEFGDACSSVDSSFASDPTVVFDIRDEDISRDSAILGAGLLARLNKRTQACFDYDARLNSDESSHILSASLQYRW